MTMHESDQMNDVEQGLADGVEDAPWLGAQWADTARPPQDEPAVMPSSGVEADIPA